MKKLLAVATAVLSLSTVVVAGEDCLEPGCAVDAFFVQDVTGPAAGEKLCYRCRYGDRPVVSIFTREVNGEVAALIKQLDGLVGKNAKSEMAGFVVLLTDEPEAQVDKLKEVAAKNDIKHVPLTTFDGPAGPPAYKIAKDADVTVMMWVDGTLKVNQPLKKGELSKDKIAAIVKESDKILN